MTPGYYARPIPGFREFRAGFSEEELLRRIGQKYELVPDLRDEEEIVETVEKSVRWVGDATVPGFAYKFFQIEATGREGSADVDERRLPGDTFNPHGRRAEADDVAAIGTDD